MRHHRIALSALLGLLSIAGPALPQAAQPAPAGSKASKSAAKRAEKSKETAKAAPSGPVDLNTASEKELVALKGVGPATAKKIIAGRPYSSVADLKKAGISAKTISEISSSVTVSGNPAPRATPPPVSQVRPSPTAPAAPAQQASTRQYVPPASPGQVWVNTESKVFHRQGDRWYGKTKEGKYMSEADALKAGYRAAK
jgi:DNA uptake protein and related DNA-binding proteins